MGEGTPTLTLSVPDMATAGTAIPAGEISTVLSGTSNVQTGDTVTFTVFAYPPLTGTQPPADCTTGGMSVGTVTVNGDGTFNPPADFTPVAAGNYWWYAAFSGDADMP